MTLYKNKRFVKTFVFFSVLITLCVFPCYSRSKNKKNSKKNDEVSEVQPIQAVVQETNQILKEEEIISIKLPSVPKNRTYFYSVNQEAVKMVENGTPEDLKNAATLIRKSESEYSENEKVLLDVAANIMNIVWPSQKVSWTVFAVGDANPYVGAINSVKKGILDLSTGNVDFLSTILPTFVLLTSDSFSDYEAVRQAIEKSLEYNSDSVLANYMAGILYKKMNDFGQAEIHLEKAYKNCNSVQEVSLAYADVLYKNGKNQESVAILDEISLSDSSNIEVLKQKAYIAFAEKKYDDAEVYVARVLQQTPNDLSFLLFRAKIFVEKKDYIHATTLLDMYARQNDDDLEYLLLRAKVQLDWSKHTSAATATVEKAIQLYPQSYDAIILAGRIASITDSLVAGKYADEWGEIALRIDPTNTEARLFALQGLIQRENWHEAYNLSNELIKSDSVSEELIMNHVQICVKVGKKSEAMQVAESEYKKNSSSELLTQAYVLAYLETHSSKESLTMIDGLINKSSRMMKSVLYYYRSFLQKTEDLVLADLRSSLTHNSRNSDTLFRLYEIYFERKDYNFAQYYLKQVVAIKPNDTSARQLNEALTQLIK